MAGPKFRRTRLARSQDVSCTGRIIATAVLEERSVFRLIGFPPERGSVRKSPMTAGGYCGGK